MRQIGTLPKDLDPKAFADYLLSIGMKTRIDDAPEGWHVWIYNEDHVPRARDELEGYRRRPDDPRFRSAAPAAEAIRRDQKQADQTFRKNYRDSSDVWGYPDFRRRPLTTLLIVACVAIFVLQNIKPGTFKNIPTGDDLMDLLSFSRYTIDEHGQVVAHGLEDIQRGEVWRLITPTLMHAHLLHIFFNLTMLQSFGTLIEVRRGTLRLLILYLVAAAMSDYGQFLWMECRRGRLVHGDVGRRVRDVRLRLDEGALPARAGDGGQLDDRQHHDHLALRLHDRRARADRQRRPLRRPGRGDGPGADGALSHPI